MMFMSPEGDALERQVDREMMKHFVADYAAAPKIFHKPESKKEIEVNKLALGDFVRYNTGGLLSQGDRSLCGRIVCVQTSESFSGKHTLYYVTWFGPDGRPDDESAMLSAHELEKIDTEAEAHFG